MPPSMIRKKYNPLVSMLISIPTWLLIMLCVFPGLFTITGISYICDLSWLFATLYLLPVVCLIVFNTALIRNRQWARKNIGSALIVNGLLFTWLINALYAYLKSDILFLWFAFIFA